MTLSKNREKYQLKKACSLLVYIFLSSYISLHTRSRVPFFSFQLCALTFSNIFARTARLNWKKYVHTLLTLRNEGTFHYTTTPFGWWPVNCISHSYEVFRCFFVFCSLIWSCDILLRMYIIIKNATKHTKHLSLLFIEDMYSVVRIIYLEIFSSL